MDASVTAALTLSCSKGRTRGTVSEAFMGTVGLGCISMPNSARFTDACLTRTFITCNQRKENTGRGHCHNHAGTKRAHACATHTHSAPFLIGGTHTDAMSRHTQDTSI